MADARNCEASATLVLAVLNGDRLENMKLVYCNVFIE
jgi:hypothetical protein